MRKNIFILMNCLLFGGLFGIIFRNNISWDFLSYHYYNGWAFLNDRLNTDFFPAMFRTYFNPVLDSCLYFLITKLNNHPYLFLFISGFNLGMFLFVSYKFFEFIFNENKEQKIYILFGLILTFISPLLLICVDFSYLEITLSILAFSALLIFAKNIFKEISPARNLMLFFSGLLTGATVGLKYTMCTFGFVTILTIILNYKSITKPLRTMFLILSGMFIGFLITDGWWMWILWKQFHNPLFPYFNNIFRSDLCDINAVMSYEFVHMRPDNIFSFVFAPLMNSLNGCIGFEWSYYDLKIPLAFISVLIYFYLVKYKNIKKHIENITNYKIFNLFLVFTILCFYINLGIFGNYRYIISLIPVISAVIIIICRLIYEHFDKNTNINIFTFCLFLILTIPLILCSPPNMIKTIKILTVLFSCIFVHFAAKNQNFSDITKKTFTALSLILILCASKMFYPFNTLSFKDFSKILEIQKIQMLDNSTVISGTMLANYIIPAQNKNVKYIGFPLTNEDADKCYSNTNTKPKNRYFIDYTVSKKIAKILKEEKNIYFIYAQDVMSENSNVFKLHEKALEKYSGGKIKHITNCKSVSYTILNQYEPWKEIFVCKIK